jgi:hypothetical protein
MITTCHILDEIILGLMSETQGLFEDLGKRIRRLLGWLEWQDAVITFHFDIMYRFGNTLKIIQWVAMTIRFRIRIIWDRLIITTMIRNGRRAI